MTDVLIPILKGGSKHSDLELRYCLRSIEKHLKGYGEIIIVGHLPDFVRDVKHIPFKDRSYLTHKQSNIRNKILAGFEVSESLLFFNDDHFLLEDVEADKFPYYWSGDLKRVAEKGAKPLIKQLRAQNKPLKHFDGHFPILYQKEAFKEAVNAFTEDVIIKSSYCNYHQIEGVYLKDLKINSRLRLERIREEIAGRPVFSIGDHGLDGHMKQVLGELYPEPSKYEIIKQNKAA